MARLLYELRKNENPQSTVYGKWFAYVKTTEVLNTRKMANHIGAHGSIYTPDVVLGVLEKFRNCLIEMLLESKRVKIDGLGTFYTTIENDSGGADTKKDFSLAENVRALHIRFMPEQEQELNISSREFIKKANFINVESLLTPEKNEEEGGGDDEGGGGNDDGGNDRP